VGGGASNPGYDALQRQVVAYERRIGGHVQVAWRDVGHGEHIASADGGQRGNADSRDPVVVNSGFYVGFESDATNLGSQFAPEAYLYTDVRKQTLLRSLDNNHHPLPGGARHPGVSYYNNYVVFSSPAPLGSAKGPDEIFMRYSGSV
jgi:hypothetical protein